MSQEETNVTAAAATVEVTKVSISAEKFEELRKNKDLVGIVMLMQDPNTSPEDKYKLAKMTLECTKTEFIDPAKEMRDAEKAAEQKEAEERAAKTAEYRDRVNKLVDQEFLDEFATLATDYIEAGHGKMISIEVIAKRDDATGIVKAEFSSNIAKPRAARGTSTRTRETGRSGAGVTVGGSPKEGVAGPTIETTQYPSFADAARALGFVDDNTDMKGLNCKRLLEKKGYSCDYVEAADKTPATEGEATPAPAPAVG